MRIPVPTLVNSWIIRVIKLKTAMHKKIFTAWYLLHWIIANSMYTYIYIYISNVFVVLSSKTLVLWCFCLSCSSLKGDLRQKKPVVSWICVSPWMFCAFGLVYKLEHFQCLFLLLSLFFRMINMVCFLSLFLFILPH